MAGTLIDAGITGGSGAVGKAGEKALAKELEENLVKNAAKKAAKAVARKGGKLAGRKATEFSHWIPKRTLIKISKRVKNPDTKEWIVNKFGKSKWNGNDVTPERHYLHDDYRMLAGSSSKKALKGGRRVFTPKKYHPIIQQIDRTPVRVRVVGGVTGNAVHHFGGHEHKKH